MDPVITRTALAERLAAPDPPVLLDVRWLRDGPHGRRQYESAHIPGARFIDLDGDLAGPSGLHGRHPLPPPQVFQDAMRRSGVSAERDVVVYDRGENGMSAASRAWWMLRWAGHDRARVLEGGLRDWSAAGHAVERGYPADDLSAAGYVTEHGYPADEWGDFTVRPGGMRLLNADEAAATARKGLLLDARAPERYRGDFEPYDAVAGHIPGAVSAPAAYNVNEHGLFVPLELLRERFARLGADRAPEVGVYCGSGVRAAQQVLSLARSGIPAGLYVGSWSDWISDPTRPIATGPLPG